MLYGERVMEIYLDDRVVVVNENALRKAQALWRGCVVRTRMKRLKKIYEDIFYEIEQSSEKDPWATGYLRKIWTDESLFCKPLRNCTRSVHLQNDATLETETARVADKEVQVQQPLEQYLDDRSSVVSDCVTHNSKPRVAGSNELKQTGCQREPVKLSTPTELREGTFPSLAERMSETMDDDTSTRLGHDTSVWDSVDVTSLRRAPVGREQERKQIVMELLWVQQAINSRKQYLQLREQLS